MEQKDPSELVREVKEEQRRRGDIASEALAWFLDGRIGSFYPRQDAVEELSETLDISHTAADTAIADTVGDVVDPVQQIVRAGERYVGVIDYRVYESEGAYGYVDFDDRKGKRNRVVCARCVEKHDYDEQIRHATQGEGSLSPDATRQDLLNAITAHYADSHTHPPSDIEPGASLVSGTTIGGNTAFHTGNLADRGAVTITPSTNNQTIPEGFHNGNGFVEGDADLIADNIVEGTTIFGVTGNAEKITNYLPPGDYSFSNTIWGGSDATEHEIVDPPGKFQAIDVDISFVNGDLSGGSVDIYANFNGIDGSYGDGTKVASSYTPPNNTGTIQVQLNQIVTPNGNDVTLEFLPSGFGDFDSANVRQATTSVPRYSIGGSAKSRASKIRLLYP